MRTTVGVCHGKITLLQTGAEFVNLVLGSDRGNVVGTYRRRAVSVLNADDTRAFEIPPRKLCVSVKLTILIVNMFATTATAQGRRDEREEVRRLQEGRVPSFLSGHVPNTVVFGDSLGYLFCVLLLTEASSL